MKKNPKKFRNFFPFFLSEKLAEGRKKFPSPTDTGNVGPLHPLRPSTSAAAGNMLVVSANEAGEAGFLKSLRAFFVPRGGKNIALI